jgi:hypothetical protein
LFLLTFSGVLDNQFVTAQALLLAATNDRGEKNWRIPIGNANFFALNESAFCGWSSTQPRSHSVRILVHCESLTLADGHLTLHG